MLDSSQNELLYQSFLFHNSQLDQTFDVMIYVRTSPETCLKRIKERARPEEKEVAAEYIKSLSDHYEKWLNPIYPLHLKHDVPIFNYYRPLAVIILDGEKPINEIEQKIKDFLMQVSYFFYFFKFPG